MMNDTTQLKFDLKHNNMKQDQNQFEKNRHPFHQFDGADLLKVHWDRTDLEREQRTRQRLSQTLQKWNSFLLLAEQFAQVASKRTGLEYVSDRTETELSQHWPAGEWRKMELLLDALGNENSSLTAQEKCDCQQAARQLNTTLQHCWTFRESIVLILRDNFELEREVFTLKQQVSAFEKEKISGQSVLTNFILPGRVLQNDLNVDWSWLREHYGMVLDEPVGHYLYAIKRILEKPVVTNSGEMLLGDLISHTRKTLLTTHELDESSLLNIEQELHRSGLCFGLDLNQLFARFYYCYFANIPLSALPLSTRIFNALAAKQITVIGDLFLMDEESLLRISYMGKTSLIELGALIKAMGFKFSMQEQDFRRLYSV
jgi:hypothetical protein